MTQSEASDACKKMGEAHAAVEADHERAPRVSERVQMAVFNQAFEFIPEETAWTVIPAEGDTPPKLAALDGLRLYTLTVGDLSGDLTPSSSCRSVTLDPEATTVECETKYTGIRRNAHPVSRVTTWRFDLGGGDDLTFATKVDADQSRLPQDDWFAQSLAKTLGWTELPNAANEGALAA
jgi:hypothetical protein